MACALTSESRRLYSWWWDSHIIPKNSKWLQENLTDMDTKVKSMIKLIEEDADSFARRAEMYYKKRPELMKLVEEFYRTYRALAERYDYATAELRHAQKTLQAAFPDQELFTLLEDSSSSTDPDAQMNAYFGLQLFLQSTNDKDECEVERLKKAVADLIAEKDSLFVPYQFSSGKLSNADGELNPAGEKSTILEEKANEVHTLKETLGLLQAEKESGLNKHMERLETISDFEEKINRTDKRAQGAESERRETEVEKLKHALLELTEEKEALRVLYAECLEKSFKLELDLSSAQSDVQRLTTEIVNSTKELKRVQENCVRLETSNRSLKMEVSDLAKKIMLKDQELSNKQDELKNTEVEFAGQCAAIQNEIFNLKEEITSLNTSYSSLTGQLELTGLNPESFGSTVKYLQDENSRLKQTCENHGEHEEKIKTVIEKNTDLESSCELLHVEKSALAVEKTVLLSQLHSITADMQKDMDQKTVYENSLNAANIKLENLREPLTGLEEIHELLNNQNSNLLVENVQKRLQTIENRFMQFEKQEHESCMMMNQKRLDELENHIEDLQKEIKLKKEEYQEELDKAVIAQFENFILRKYVKELEDENYALSVENGKHIEESKLSDKLISELETEILEQRVEEELLLVDVENLRSGIRQVYSSLRIGSNPPKISIKEIIGNIEDLKRALSKEEDDKKRVLIENTVISTVLHQLKSGFWESELMSNTRDIVFESKVHELVEVCESLESETVSKGLEIEDMMQKMTVMERDIEGLNAQLRAYTPIIGSLKENISSLERNVFTVANIIGSNNRKAEDVEMKVHPHHNQSDPEFTRVPKSLEPTAILDLIELQTRIEALEKLIAEINTIRRRKPSGTNIKPKPSKPEPDESKSNDQQKRHKEQKLRAKQRYLTLDHLHIPKSRPELSEIRDIPLDHASEGSSSANSRSRTRRGYLRNDDMLIEQLQIAHKIYETEHKSSKLPYEPQTEDLGVYRLKSSNQESKKQKLLQRIESDAHKLANLEMKVKDLAEILEIGKQSKKGKNPNCVDFKVVRERLEEAEGAILDLANVNVESIGGRRSERIKTVQMDVEKIRCVLQKLEDGKNGKGKSRFSMSKSRTGVILGDFVHRGRNSSGRIKRRRLCGCFIPSPARSDGNKN